MSGFLKRLAVRLVKSDLLRWLETRVLYLPSKDVDRLAERFGVSAELVRDVERKVVSELMKLVESQLRD